MEKEKHEEGFVTLPEAPVYRPTQEEFEDPIKYVDSIRSEAEKFGICKVIPPANWNPPFQPDPNEFKFKPRILHLNLLEAETRLKVKWMQKLRVFWSMRGPLRIPKVQGKALDLFMLNELILNDEVATVDDYEATHWASLASKMGLRFDDAFDVSSLQAAYYGLIYPMITFLSSLSSPTVTEIEREILFSSGKENDQNQQNKAQHSKNPKTKLAKIGQPKKHSGTRLSTIKSILVSGKCPSCNLIELEKCVSCDSCKKKFHIPCLIPQPEDFPGSDWIFNCRNCVIENLLEVITLDFGFKDADGIYNLIEFGEYADLFKTEYFNVESPHSVPTKEVEREFWKIVGSPELNVEVMYGADLHVLKHGSGFPTSTSKQWHPDSKNYIESGWNLNNFNLPESSKSLLKFIKSNVSGMKVPWLYVGMCFSSFCWHNEDHWTYSINYLHWGEIKTWYGVPGLQADRFEARMKELVPELFQCQPDILHQLTTLLHPSKLLSGNVDIYRLDQNAGEFVITFPRAYHAGFNNGFNFAEAVNFATTTWLPYGFHSIPHYGEHRRSCVFSHEEMLCEMVRQVSSLDLDLAREAYEQLSVLLSQEKKFRDLLIRCGVKNQQRIIFEDFEDDDDRSCASCKTTVFFSSVVCSCSKIKRVCIRHYQRLRCCPNSKLKLQFRYKIEELEKMVKTLFDRFSTE